MKEGLVNLPEDVVILQEKHLGEKRRMVLKPLPLRRIPESEAEQLKQFIEYIQARQKKR